MRIVSLCPSLTELVHDLGAADQVVGRTRFCIHPAPWVEGIERVGGTKNPNLARIIALAPDLVLMNEEENRREDALALRAAGLAVHTSMPRTVRDVPQMVRDIAAAIARDADGERIAADIEQRAARVACAASARDPVSHACCIWREPWMTVNDDTFISAMLELGGARNVFGDRGDRYPAFSLDELRLAAPDVVFLTSEPFPFGERHVAELVAATGWAPARFALVDGELLSWHGSRTPAGIDYAEAIVERVRAAPNDAAGS
ncbi:MAG: ABC transporter substrate-binding protein [Gemmatimonadaceae bacterium]|nr:ABC transporter substrate-binding protein [Gemmatimonadaceae bacterium]